MKWDKLIVKDAVSVHLLLNRKVLGPKLPTACHVHMVRSQTRPLTIVHADAFRSFIGWIVLARAQHVHHTVLFARTIQQYLLLTTSGNGQISLKKNCSKVLSTIFILLDRNTTSHIPRSIRYPQSHSNVPMPGRAKVELTQVAFKDIKGLCVQPALTAFISDLTLA